MFPSKYAAIKLFLFESYTIEHISVSIFIKVSFLSSPNIFIKLTIPYSYSPVLFRPTAIFKNSGKSLKSVTLYSPAIKQTDLISYSNLISLNKDQSSGFQILINLSLAPAEIKYLK